MPLPYIHISAMRHVAADLANKGYQPVASDRINPKWDGFDIIQSGKLLTQYSNFASLGAIGPDLLAFIPDFKDKYGVRTSSILTHVIKTLDDLYETFDPFITKWEKYLGPISEDTAEEMSRLTGGLSETIGDITGELGSITITELEDTFIQVHDWWGFFSLGLNSGYDEQAFTWLDMLHYRETGSFARTLWNAADSQSDEARAYALGYITHVATDVTGHAFVNAITGGPFRLHWQRHHLVENHMDAYWYLKDEMSTRSGDRYCQLTESALYFDIAFDKNSGKAIPRPDYPIRKTLREIWERHRMHDIDPDIPDSMKEIFNKVLLRTMTDIFYQKNDKHPKILDNDGLPSVDDIEEAYKLLFRYLKHTTVDGFAIEPPDPPGNIFANLNPPMPTLHNDEPPGEDDKSFWTDIWDAILSVIAAIAYVVELAAWLATLPWAALADVVAYPLRLMLYYTLELPLFHILKAFRSVLVMTGYLLPMKDEIALSRVHIGFTDDNIFGQILGQIGDIMGGLTIPDGPGLLQTFQDSAYPHLQPEIELPALLGGGRYAVEYLHPWEYPAGIKSEKNLTTASPYDDGASVDVLFGDIPPDPVIRERLETAQDPDEADLVGPNLTPNHHLGDVISFSKYLIWLESRNQTQEDKKEVPVVEWNLDGDRGYGYHCWDWNRNYSQKEEYPKDPEGNHFPPPCTWPQQSELWKPDVPLLLHCTGKDDPGCNPISSPDPNIDRATSETSKESRESLARQAQRRTPWVG